MQSLLLLLLDSRAPAGAHSHSAGMEAAVEIGWVETRADLEQFCRGRLHTTGRVTAAFAAAACELAARSHRHTVGGSADAWAALDAELDARTPSEATRAASRQLGSGLLRLLRATVPDLETPWTTIPHHPLVLGAAVAIAGGDPTLAARAALLATCTAPASAAVRLLGLDPFAVHGLLAELTGDIDALSAEAGRAAATTECADLPAFTAPALELLADVHRLQEVRLFAS